MYVAQRFYLRVGALSFCDRRLRIASDLPSRKIRGSFACSSGESRATSSGPRLHPGWRRPAAPARPPGQRSPHALPGSPLLAPTCPNEEHRPPRHESPTNRHGHTNRRKPDCFWHLVVTGSADGHMARDVVAALLSSRTFMSPLCHAEITGRRLAGLCSGWRRRRTTIASQYGGSGVQEHQMPG
jgi:hypothetical protein